MLKTLAALLVVPLTACAVSDSTSDPTFDPSSPDLIAAKPTPGVLPALGADQEYAFFKGHTETFRFANFFTPQAETFFIWNLGTTIQHGAPYPSSSHSKLYAVFAPGPAGSVHHVNGQDGFDHYHVINNDDGSPTFDVFLVFTGPNFNAATFKAPLSEADVLKAVTAGVLGAPLNTVDAGFGPLVIKVPISEFEGH